MTARYVADTARKRPGGWYTSSVFEEDGSEDGILWAEGIGRSLREAEERAEFIALLLNRAPSMEAPS